MAARLVSGVSIPTNGPIGTTMKAATGAVVLEVLAATTQP
jgi:hypothetical protein